MRAFSLLAFLGILLAPPALAQSSADPLQSDEALSNLMIAMQSRHIKLWFSGKFANWKLAAYEVNQMETDLGEVAKRASPPQPTTAKGISLLRDSIEARDTQAFVKAYSELTNECNACHRAHGRDYISVLIPTYSPFADQNFTDQVAEGRALVNRICSNCHVVAENASPRLAPVYKAPSFADLVARPSFTGDNLRQLLGSEHRRVGPEQAMPNPRLNDYQIEAIVAYFETLKAEHKVGQQP
jgi:mono/diheme cytochrome c family protein